jgi:hypothetical protein
MKLLIKIKGEQLNAKNLTYPARLTGRIMSKQKI